MTAGMVLNSSNLLNALAGPALEVSSWLTGSRLASILDELDTAQWMTPRELQNRAETKLSSIARYAAETLPFYRHGLHLPSGSHDGFHLLSQFPVIDKFTFLDGAREQFQAAELLPARGIRRTTSGSTGEPFVYYLDREMMPAVYASHLFYDTWFGLRPFDRCARISSAHPPEVLSNLPIRQRALAGIKGLYENLTQLTLPVWEIDSGKLQSIYDRLREFRPAYLLGYASTIALLAEHMTDRGLALDTSLKAVVSIAETLTPSRRRAIRNCFEAPIANRYGLREFGAWSAQSCPEAPDALHINSEMVAVEFLDSNDRPVRPGELGRVVITDLLNRVMPFIRYDTGDLAVCEGAAACPCGRGFARFGGVEGRSTETIETPSGRSISATVIGRYFRDGGPLFDHKDHIDFIRHYQAIQEDERSIRFLVVPQPSFDEQRQDLLMTDLRKLFGLDTNVRVELVQEIPVERSGKRPLVKRRRRTAETGSKSGS